MQIGFGSINHITYLINNLLILKDHMETSSLFIKFLQACITPVAMISGVGLLLLTITNRLGRVVDRTRQLVADLDIASCLKIPLLFIMNLTGTDLKAIGYSLLIISIFSLLLSLIYFFKDILLSLNAVKLEASDYIKKN